MPTRWIIPFEYLRSCCRRRSGPMPTRSRSVAARLRASAPEKPNSLAKYCRSSSAVR